MRLSKTVTVFCLLIYTLMLSGCGSSTAYTTPPESLSLEEAGKINLQVIDMGKLTKARINDVSGISLEQYGSGYDIKSRYLNNNITVKIVKFKSPSQGDKFWDLWTERVDRQDSSQNGVSIVSFTTKTYSVRAWQKGSWFTYVAVPTAITNHKELVDRITQYINYEYQEL